MGGDRGAYKFQRRKKNGETQDGCVEFSNFTYSSSIHQLLIDYTNQGYSARPTCASHSAAFPRRGAKGPPPRWRTCAWRARGHRPKKETLTDAPWTPHSRRMGKVSVGYLEMWTILTKNVITAQTSSPSTFTIQ